MVGGKQEHFPIRMVECADCGRSFSLLPSFLAREKHVALEIIGHVVEKMTLFGQSLSASLKDLEIVRDELHSTRPDNGDHAGFTTARCREHRQCGYLAGRMSAPSRVLDSPDRDVRHLLGVIGTM
ncbi:MAG: hypothetical protein GY801_35370 [bacterium]|nr:hypothetical protein [bacterium]